MDDLPIIPVVYGVKLLEMMDEENLRTDYILRECGMNRSLFQNPEAMLTARQARAVVGKYLGLTGRNYPALRYGRRLDLITHGLLGFVFGWRGNFRDMLCMILDYLRVRLPMMTIEMVSENDYFALRITSREPNRVYNDFLVQSTMASMYDLGSKVTKNIVVLCRPDFLADSRDLQSMMRVQVSADATHNEIRYYSSEVNMRARELGETAREQASDPFQDHGVVVRLRSFLLANLGRNQSAEEMAAHLGMSERTLRRKLADSGLSFNRVRIDVRMQVAERYLKTSDMSIERIAEMVGYSDQATFTRAFGEWSGQTPLGVRRQHRRKPADARPLQVVGKAQPAG